MESISETVQYLSLVTFSGERFLLIFVLSRLQGIVLPLKLGIVNRKMKINVVEELQVIRFL